METNEFWKGAFGNSYQERQKESKVGSVESNIQFFIKSIYEYFQHRDLNSIVEVGAGTGQNIKALHETWPEINLKSIELNPIAAHQIPYGEVYIGDALKIEWPKADLVLTKGFLIHIPPEDIPCIFDKIINAANKYILLCEYYNPTPIEIPYRGHAGKLWKRDFAGEMLDRYPQLSLADYGFAYHLDEYPQDDLNWFLLEKTNAL